jgi:hypothetical protein
VFDPYILFNQAQFQHEICDNVYWILFDDDDDYDYDDDDYDDDDDGDSDGDDDFEDKVMQNNHMCMNSFVPFCVHIFCVHILTILQTKVPDIQMISESLRLFYP